MLLVNGNINRLRAMASGHILSKETGHECKFVWLDEYICRNNVTDLFTDDFYLKNFLGDDQNSSEIIINYKKFKKGITFLNSEEIIIRGKSNGENYYLNKLVKNHNISDFQRIFIISGGLFWNPSNTKHTIPAEFEQLRNNFYNQLQLNPTIMQTAQNLQNKVNEDFIGLHLRYKDLVSHSPSKKIILKFCQEIRKKHKINKIFICSDDEQKKHKMIRLLKRNNFDVFYHNIQNVKRIEHASNYWAILDWATLSKAKALVHFGSSFGEEAKIAGNFTKYTFVIKSSLSRQAAYLPIEILFKIRQKILSLINTGSKNVKF